MKQRVVWILAGLGSSAIAGCYEKVSENDRLIFSYQIWVPLMVVLGGLAALPVGIVLIVRKKYFWGYILAIGGPLAAVVIAPGMFLDRVIVDQEGFYSRHGFWWDSTIHQIRYDELVLVRLVVEEKIGRGGRKNYSYYFDCSFKTRTAERVPLGDVMRQAIPEIAEQFRKHGVQVQIPPNLPD